MSIVRGIKSALGCVGHWIGEAYCAISQRIEERIEQASDTIAEQRWLAERQVERVKYSHVPTQQMIEVKVFRAVNGHQHLK